MTEKNKAKICSNAIKAKVELNGVVMHLDKCENAADFDSPESVIVRNIHANIAEAYRDLEILINRKHKNSNQRMCLRDRSKVCNLCHDCDVDVLNPGNSIQTR